MSSSENIRDIFFQECEEQLAELERGLIAFENGGADKETVDSVFRAVHSIKGGAGAFHFSDLVRFAHGFETVLDDIRSDRLQVDAACARTLLRAADILGDLVRGAQSGLPGDAEKIEAALRELEGLHSGGDETAAPSEFDDLAFTPITFDFDAASAGGATYNIDFAPNARMYALGNEPAPLLNELRRLGDATVALDYSAVPLLDELDPAQSYLRWSAELQTQSTEDDIRDIFEFVSGDCTLAITKRAAPAENGAPDTVSDVVSLLAALEKDLGEPARAPVAERSAPLPAAQPETALVAQKAPASANVSTIRIETLRLDRLVDFIGELVINQAMLAQWISQSGLVAGSPIANGLDELERLTREIQDSAMAIRAQPIGPVFQRMGRVVREVAQATGKSARLVCEGEATEIDKTVIERIAEPLTHMVRNAIDHGLETPEARRAIGKSETGVITLSARHRSGRIIIEISDDGAGVRREKVLSRAIEKGLVAPDARLSDAEIDNLLFLPGFSTAAAVTDISGRGVGMDVVRKSIGALGGRISIASEPGKGSLFTLSLPLTLAVLDGMIVKVADQTLVLPITAIVETFQARPEILRPLGAHSYVVAVREAVTPLTDIGVALGLRHRIVDPVGGVVILVESEGGGRRALLADSIVEQRQIVVKSIENNYGAIRGIAAATILGDGRVALILDVDALIEAREPDFSNAA
ncbi:MAG: chemotaxis protein CheA [Hyphomicrobiales bacterium]|nr:chemotaxis protein CheA [Hyphomicrobiales bacterium]